MCLIISWSHGHFITLSHSLSHSLLWSLSQSLSHGHCYGHCLIVTLSLTLSHTYVHPFTHSPIASVCDYVWLCVCVTVCDCVTMCDCVWLCDYVWLCVTVCDCVDEKERAMWLLCVMWQSGWEGDEWWMMRGDGCCVLRSDEKWWEVMGEWWKTQKRNSSTRGSQVVTYPSTRLAWGGLTSRSGTRSGANRLVWPELLTCPLSAFYTTHPHPTTHTPDTHHSTPIHTHQCVKTPKNTQYSKNTTIISSDLP